MKDNKNIELLLTFLKIGVFTFGGGYAMIPLIQREIVDTKKWISDAEMLDIIAVAESTPGPLAINAATFVGNHTGGKKGALAATVGVTLPSFVIILLISVVLNQVEHLQVIKDAFMGIRAGVLVLILSALVHMFGSLQKSAFHMVLLIAAFLAVGIFKVSAILVLCICAMIGILRMKLTKN